MRITRHYLTVNSSDGQARRVHYRRFGSGPPLLMVHQSPRSSAEYETLMRQWGAYFTCIAPDTPGFGQSDPLSHPNPDIADYADALAEFVHAMGIAPCAAYGFHSGGIICVTAVKRHKELFSGLAIGGYAIWTKTEMEWFGADYLPEFQPSDYGEHLTWLWNRILEQSWFFPWFDVRDEARLSGAHADPERVHAVVMEMLDAGNHYRSGYGAVLRAPRDIPEADADASPCLITAYDGDPLQAHIDRLGPLPAGWEARKVASPAEHQAQSLAFLRKFATVSSSELPEDQDAGWIAIDQGLVHWRGDRDAKRMVLHGPGDELCDPGEGTIAIDVPGHGLSSDSSDIEAIIREVANFFGIKSIAWPAAPTGDADQLYPDLTPDRFGSHLAKAWSIARAQALFEPWYAAHKDQALPVDPNLLRPQAIARRARALLRAGSSARRWNDTLLRMRTEDRI
jgi:haloalkane dehalogenase